MEEQPVEMASVPDQPTEPRKVDHQQRLDHWLQAITAIMLGVVAVATAWSGYQSTRWSGVQAALYSEASGLRVESSRASDQAGNDRLYDVNLFDAWLTADSEGNTALANIFKRRFRQEFLPAYYAWLATDPFHNPAAPQGPLFMPQYQLQHATQAAKLEAEATQLFNQGQDANQRSDDYVLNTVFLAVVLFLTAISERFKWQVVRVGILVLAAAMLVFGLHNLFVYPIT
jgi:hypothetical protein